MKQLVSQDKDTEDFYVRRKGSSANLKNLDKFKEIFESWRAKNFRTSSLRKIIQRNFLRRQMTTVFPLPNSRSAKVQALAPKKQGSTTFPLLPGCSSLVQTSRAKVILHICLHPHLCLNPASHQLSCQGCSTYQAAKRVLLNQPRV